MCVFGWVLCACRCDDNLHGYDRILQSMHGWQLLCRDFRGARDVLVFVGVLFARRGSQLVLWNCGLVHSMWRWERVRWCRCCAELL